MANHRTYHLDRPTTNAERAKKCRDKKRVQAQPNRYAKEGETCPERKQIAPAQPAIVTLCAITDGEAMREVAQKPQEITAGTRATCHVCGRNIEFKDGEIEWHVNFGTLDICEGGTNFP